MALHDEQAACDQDCPIARAHDVLGGKWTTLIFRELVGGRRRYGALARRLPGISPRMLSERLRFLESQGLVCRTLYPTIPPTTDYELTDLGWQMQPVIGAMAAFGEALQQHDRDGVRKGHAAI